MIYIHIYTWYGAAPLWPEHIPQNTCKSHSKGRPWVLDIWSCELRTWTWIWTWKVCIWQQNKYKHQALQHGTKRYVLCRETSTKALSAPLATLQWRHNEHDGVSNHQPHNCLLNRLLRLRSKKTPKLRVADLECVVVVVVGGGGGGGGSMVTGEFLA